MCAEEGCRVLEVEVEDGEEYNEAVCMMVGSWRSGPRRQATESGGGEEHEKERKMQHLNSGHL